MKIERLNENQIRCTLNKSDLASRQLKISELAYGSDKARELFRDMMQQASYELGFEAEDIPLMIEAIPVSAECIVLIVTKVDNPEELDTRFSKFSPTSGENEDDDNYYDDYYDMEEINDYSDNSPLPTANEELDLNNNDSSDSNIAPGADLMNLFSKVRDYLNTGITPDKAGNNTSAKNDNSTDSFVPLSHTLNNNTNKQSKADTPVRDDKTDKQKTAPVSVTRVFSFDSMDDFIDGAAMVNPIFSDWNALYKKPGDDKYYLVLTRSTCSPVNFNKTCNILSEYGTKEPAGETAMGFFKEHCTCIIPKHAIKVISSI
ncbi:MAG: adaptor protein MecA [Eubacteriales bacterium]|nr:adaptor protein MecA [Eubacteriales bacterium]